MNTEIEEWKNIVGFEGLYMVSSFGNIKSLSRTAVRRDNTTRTVPEKILSLIKKDGYLVITLSKEGKDHRRRVNILVALAFKDNPLGLKEVNHEDGNKLNNRASNLSWCDRSGNIKHAYATGLRKSLKGIKRKDFSKHLKN